MAKENSNQQPQQLHQQQQVQQMPPIQKQPRFAFRMSWVWVVISLLFMWYLLKHIKPVMTWDQIMDLISVKNKEQYSMLAILCIVITFIVATVKILGRKDE